MGSKKTVSLATCQACGKKIDGRIHRFDNVPDSAFCSIECQISKTEITGYEVKLKPITKPLPPPPRFDGPVATRLHDDRGCECGVFFGNQITVPKRHSIVCFCPKCGCVTVD